MSLAMNEKNRNTLAVNDDFDDDVEQPLTGGRLRSSARSRRPNPSLAALSLICSSVLFVASLMVLYIARHNGPLQQQCVKQTSTYSPLLDAVQYSSYNFENGFVHRSKYRGTPTNELETEWERLWNHGLIAVPDAEFSLLNKSAEADYMRVPKEKGGGYAVNIEVFHHLHCLNLVRQYTYRDHYTEHAEHVQTPHDLTIGTEKELRIHVDHCLETLRLTLMCQADVTPFLYIYGLDGDDEHLGASDFDSNHKCRNFDHIRDEFLKRTVIERWPGGNRQWTKGEDRPL